MTFQEKIRSLRKALNLTQDELAIKSNTCRATFANYENGKRIPPVDVAARIAKALNVSMDYLFADEMQCDVEPADYVKALKSQSDKLNMMIDGLKELCGRLVRREEIE